MKKFTVDPKDMVKRGATDFRSFIDEQNVVGVAVGLAVGGAVTILATSFINNIVMVPLGFVLGSADGLRGLAIELGVKNGQVVMWNYGIFLNDLVNFMIVLLVFYLVIKIFHLDHAGKKIERK